MVKAQQLHDRFINSVSRKSNWETLYREALEYFSPQRDTFYDTQPGEKRTNTDLIFDSTGQQALEEAVSNAQNDIFPPQKNWGRLSLKSSVIGNRVSKENKVQKITQQFFEALHRSNFDTQIAEFLEDWMIGTGSMLMHKGTVDRPFIFEAVPLNEVYLERGKFGGIDGRFRKWKIPVSLILKTWPDAKITDELKELLNGKPYENVSVVESTIEDDIDNIVLSTDRNGRTIRKKAGTIKGYRYVVMLEKDKDILVNREMRSHPWINVRYSVSAGEVYGRGPVLKALADYKTLNKVKELVLKNGELAISGMWTVVDDGIINLENIVLEPAALISVSANPGNPMGPQISRLPAAGDFNVSQIIIEDLVKSIKNILMAEPMGEIDAPVKSPTEITYRAQRTAKRMGSPFGRMQSEGAEQIILRGIYILEELGLIDLSDLYVADSAQSEISVQYESPLAIAQDQEELFSLTRYAEIISTFFGQQALLIMTDPIKFSKELSALLGVKNDVLPTEEQMEEIKNILTQQLTAQQEQPQ